VPVAGGRDKERGYVTDIQGRLASNAYTSLFDLRDSRQLRFGRSRYAAYRDAVSASTGEPYAADTYDEGYAAWLLDDVETRMQDRAERMGDDNARRSLRFYFSRLKKPVEISFSPLQHSTATEEAEVEAPIGYRTFKNVSLAELPALLARVTLRKRHEGRRTTQTEALENPMSYWDDQYSKSPYGARRSVPPARRNRGRPRTSKKTGQRTNMEGRNPTEWPMLREGQAKLKRLAAKGDKEAKRELEYRKILRADSTTSKARGKSAKVTKGKNLSDWQAFQHEMRGKGMTSAQMSAAYRKKMAEPKRKTKSKAKATSKAKAAAPKNGRKVGWIAFWKRAAAAGYTMKQTQPLWKKYKAGKGTLASLLKPKKKAMAKKAAAPKKAREVRRHGGALLRAPRKTAAMKKKAAAEKAAPKRKTSARSRAKGRKVSAKKMNKGLTRYQVWRRGIPNGVYTRAEISAMWEAEKHALLNPRDLTHRREALVPSSQDHYWDNSVETALMNPEYEDYDDFDYGPFSTGLAHTHGVQPVNRRNPSMPAELTWNEFQQKYRAWCRRKGRTCKQKHVAKNWEFYKRGDPVRLPKLTKVQREKADWQDFTRRHTDPMFYNPRRSRHPIYEQTRGQFGVSEAWTHGVQPYGRRNPAMEPRIESDGGIYVGSDEIGTLAPASGGDYAIEIFGETNIVGSAQQGREVLAAWWAKNGAAVLAAGWGSSHNNPSHSHTASDPWHPVYEQIIGQFSTSEPWTHGVQPYSRRNPYYDVEEDEDDFILFEDDY
jgi:hypothetical protein